MALEWMVAYYRLMENFLINSKDMAPRDWLIDSGIALGAFAFGCLQLILSMSPIIITDELFRQMIGVINTSPSISAYIAMALTTLPLVLRRQFSWPVFIFVTVIFLGTQDAFRGYSLTIIGPAVALYTIAHERGRIEAIIATALGTVALLFVVLPASNQSMAMFVRIQNISYLVVAVLGGFVVRSRQDYVEATEQRALAAEKSREEEAARRVEEERVRIAREIHDITAHSLSAVSIQAAAAERLVDKDPAAAKEAIKTVRATSKDALEEIRCMIGVLRCDGGKAETAPTAGTERMGDLVDYLKDARIGVDYSDEGFDRSRVASYIDIALYGIAREAVTNVVRHAQATRVSLRLWVDDANAYLHIEDDGVGCPDGVCIDGHGIQGMRERVNVIGGTLEAGNGKQCGFSVNVAIPLVETGKYHA